MARLIAAVRGGFYPAHPAAVRHISRLIQPGDYSSTCVIDPCCGAGEAISTLTTELGIPSTRTYAIELEPGRASEAKFALPGAHVVGPASFFGTAISSKSFGLVWLNPPFDYEIGGYDENEGLSRTETAFLDKATNLLREDGILILICPENVAALEEVHARFASWFDNFSVTPFPAAHRPFREVAVIGIKRRDKRYYAWGDTWSQNLISPRIGQYVIPPSTGPLTFKKIILTDDEIHAGLAASPLMRHLQPSTVRSLPSPPMSPKSGHVALMLASGHLNGVVEPPGEPPHLVRGTARKITYISSHETDEDGEGRERDTTVYSQKIVIVVRTVDQDGNIQTFNSDPELKEIQDVNGSDQDDTADD